MTRGSAVRTTLIRTRVSDDDPIPDRDFEERYIDFVREDNAGFELFKVARRRGGPRDYSFDKYYVIPPITRRQAAAPTPELTGAGTGSASLSHAVVNGNSESQNRKKRFAQSTLPSTCSTACSM